MSATNPHLKDIIEANQLLMSMGGQDQMPAIASASITRSLELQDRINRAIRYAEETHTSSLHARQMLRILDGSITIDDHNNEVHPEPVVRQQPLADFPAVEHKELAASKPHRSNTSPLADRNTEERKAFRNWLDEQGRGIPYNQPVPPELVAEFDEATGGKYKPKPRKPYAKPKSGQRGKLRPGHGLEGRSSDERAHLRQWLTEQGYDLNPSGRIPQRLIDHYDAAMRELARMQREQREQQAQQQEQEQHAQSA